MGALGFEASDFSLPPENQGPNHDFLLLSLGWLSFCASASAAFLNASSASRSLRAFSSRRRAAARDSKSSSSSRFDFLGVSPIRDSFVCGTSGS